MDELGQQPKAVRDHGRMFRHREKVLDDHLETLAEYVDRLIRHLARSLQEPALVERHREERGVVRMTIGASSVRVVA